MDTQIANTNMVLQQIKPWEVLDQSLLDLIKDLPREDFLPKKYHELAYADTPIPLGFGEFSFSPKIEARILQALAIEKHHSILEIGTGCGYLTGLLATLGNQVDSIDQHETFTEQCRTTLKRHNIYNTALITQDFFSLVDNTIKQYDVVVIGGGLFDKTQLPLHLIKPRGKLFCFLGQTHCLQANLLTENNEEFHIQTLFETDIKHLQNAKPTTNFTF